MSGTTSSATTGVLVTGAAGGLGWRAVNRLEEQALLEVHAEDEVHAAVAGIDVLVHLGAADHDTRARRRENLTSGIAGALARADALGVRHLVLVSSAMVYGAWANNPVPLTEEAPICPDPEFIYARQLASVEQLVDDWRRAEPGRTATILRPALSMAADGTSSVARALAAGMGQRFAEEDPAAQFLHLDDLASAVALAATRRLDGVYNVAPDGSVPGDTVRALSGGRSLVKLPGWMAELLGSLRWRFQRGPIPPGLRSYARVPWLVANDRLRAHGWSPTVTNEQAYVEGTEAKWWTMVTPKRRQEIALGAMVVATVAVVAGLAVALRRAHRRSVARRGD